MEDRDAVLQLFLHVPLEVWRQFTKRFSFDPSLLCLHKHLSAIGYGLPNVVVESDEFGIASVHSCLSVFSQQLVLSDPEDLGMESLYDVVELCVLIPEVNLLVTTKVFV